METNHTLPPEETIEEKLDRINTALQHTMLEMDVSSQHIRNTSRVSYLNSYTTSYCNFDWIDGEAPSMLESKIEPQVESNIETLLQSLDRSQMQVEDFWSDHHRTSSKPDPQPASLTPCKPRSRLLKENQSPSTSALFTSIEQRKCQLDQERKNFEVKLFELDQLISTYKLKHSQLAVLAGELRVKESLLDQRDKDFKIKKNELDKAKALWESVVINDKCRPGPSKFKLEAKATIEAEALPPAVTPSRASQICSLQQSLKINELKLEESEDYEEKSKLMTAVDMIKNKIATLRGEQAMFECSKSSRIMKDMRRTMEKEVNYEENLRKINLEKFSVRGSNRNTPKSSVTPNCGASSKRFLFKEEN